MHYLGELFALTTAICWSFGTILFGYAGRRVGAFTVNVIRIPVAAVILTIVTLVLQGSLLPSGYTINQLVILAASGVIGLVIGDSCYFRSLVILGPRIASLMGASTPIFAVVISWIFLGQSLGVLDLVGIAITLAGISFVTMERDHDSFGALPGPKTAGYILGICGSLCQAIALTMAKVGMGETVPPLNATLIRMAAATVFIWVFNFARGGHADVKIALRDRKALLAMVVAALVGPSIGIWLSLASIRYTKIGIAATLMATTPLWVIPLVRIIHKERPSLRAIIGTVAAVGGVALLFLF